MSRRVGDVGGIRNSVAVLPISAQRRRASARSGPRTQPARSGVAGRGHGARRRTGAKRARRVPGRRRGARARPNLRARRRRSHARRATSYRTRRAYRVGHAGSRRPKRCIGWRCWHRRERDCGGRGDLAGSARADRATRGPAQMSGCARSATSRPKRSRFTTSIAIAIWTARASWRFLRSRKQTATSRADGMRHRLARLDRKIAKKTDAQLLWS